MQRKEEAKKEKGWKAAGPPRVLTVYAEDFSILLLKRRFTVKRGKIRVLS